MLLEDNGLLPFLEDWHFFAEPKIQSNTVVAFFSPILLFSSFTIYTLIFNPYIHYIGSCTVHLNIRLDMAILSTKLEKGLSSVRAMNFVISRRCKTLLNWTNQKKKYRTRQSWILESTQGNPDSSPPIPRPRNTDFTKKNSWIPDLTSKSFPDSEIRITVGRSIALFSLYVFYFPIERSRGNLTLCLFLCVDTGMYARE